MEEALRELGARDTAYCPPSLPDDSRANQKSRSQGTSKGAQESLDPGIQSTMEGSGTMCGAPANNQPRRELALSQGL